MKKAVLLIGLPLLAILLVASVVIAIYLGRKKSAEEATEEAIQAAQVVPPSATDELWYKNSVIYNLDVKVFKDTDGNGLGDLKGLTGSLDYLDSLGVDVLWLAPFQPSPGEDDGYDVADYEAIDPRLGTPDDFRALVQAAKARGIRVIMDVVVNHTSIQHPWFQDARKSKDSRYRSWYVWSKEQPSNHDKGILFPGVQKEIWTHDPQAGEYYLHRFYDFQPDLNAQNPDVQGELRRVLKHWVDAGVAGFRVDAVPFFIEVPEKQGEDFKHQFEILTDLRRYLKTLRGDAILLGEANVPPEESELYFGKNGDGLQMMFNFYVNQHLFYALASGKAEPLREALNETHALPKGAQWGQFLRNHDEVDLGRLSRGERGEVYDQFGPDKSMQLYDRGIRRRLAPMLGNDRKRLELAYSLLFALPSTPVIRYGDEIGMGDDLSLKERLSVRTPMQWSADRNAGFSTGEPTLRPVISSGPFDYHQVNVATEQGDPGSLLRWTTRIIHLRKACPEIAYGSWEALDTGSPHVLALRYTWQGHSLLILHNVSAEEQEVKLEGVANAPWQTLLAPASRGQRDDVRRLALEGYGYRWYRAGSPN